MTEYFRNLAQAEIDPAARSEAAAPPGLDAAMRAIDRRVVKYADAEKASSDRRDWSMADRWRHLAQGNAEAVESIRAALAATDHLDETGG